MSEPPAPLILIVEDEPKIAALLDDFLRAALFRTHSIVDGRDVLPAVRSERPDAILLDLMLPGKDGLEVCRALRAESDVPIIMVTARVAEVDRLLGLELGADDYICKPFSPREVVARVKAILRRARPSGGEPDAPRLTIDEARLEVELDGNRIALTPVEFRLLDTLASEPRRVRSRRQLLDKLYDDHRVVTFRTVDSHVKNLRRKLTLASGDPEIIRSVYGVGYRLEI